MINLQKNILGLVGASFSLVFAAQAGDGVCHHCEEIREYNAAHHQNFEYYTDYLKTVGADNGRTVAEEAKPSKQMDPKQADPKKDMTPGAKVAERNVQKPK